MSMCVHASALHHHVCVSSFSLLLCVSFCVYSPLRPPFTPFSVAGRAVSTFFNGELGVESSHWSVCRAAFVARFDQGIRGAEHGLMGNMPIDTITKRLTTTMCHCSGGGSSSHLCILYSTPPDLLYYLFAAPCSTAILLYSILLYT